MGGHHGRPILRLPGGQAVQFVDSQEKEIVGLVDDAGGGQFPATGQ